MNEVLTVSEAARAIRVSAVTVRNWEHSGKLPAIRTAGGMRLFRREDVERVIAERDPHLGPLGGAGALSNDVDDQVTRTVR